MPTIEQCSIDVKKILGEEADEGIIKEMAEKVKNAHEASTDLNDFEQQILQVLRDNEQEAGLNAKIEVENAIKKIRGSDFLGESFKDNPFEFFESLAAGTDRIVLNGNKSVQGDMRIINGKLNNNLFREIRANEGVKVKLKKGDESFFKDTMVAMFEMGRTKIDSSKMKSLDSDAVKLGEILRRVNSMAVEELRLAGSPIREIDNYIMRQTHDPGVIRKMGKKAWISLIQKNLNHRKTFGSNWKNKKFKSEFLGAIYNDIVAEVDSSGVGISKRKLHFKSGEDFFEYNKTAGRGDLMEGVFFANKSTARQAALLRRLGTNPKETWGAWKKEAQGLVSGDQGKLDKFKGMSNRIDNLLKEMMGETEKAGHGTVAKTARNARALKDMSALGKVALSSIPDLATSASMLRSLTGEGFLGSHSKLINNFMEALPKERRQVMAERTHVFMEDMLGELYSHIGVGEAAIPGAITKAHSAFFTVNGLRLQTSMAKSATAKQFAMELADFASRNYADLPTRVTQNLGRYGLGEKHWDVLKQATEDISGPFRTFKAVTTEGIAEMPDELFEQFVVAPSKHPKRRATQIKQAKKEIELSVGNYLSDMSEGVPQSGFRERALALQGTRDEGLGIMLRMVAQFKSFPLTMYRLMSRVAQSDPDAAGKTFNQFFSRFVPGSQKTFDMASLGGLIASTTAMGYVSLALKDLATGREPSDPSSPETIKRAMLQGGSLGLYGDFMLAEYGRGRSVAKDILGPVVGDVLSDAGEIMSTALSAKGEDNRLGKLAQKSFRFTIDNMPGSNLLFARTGLDYMILNEIQENLSPGFARRLERRVEENPGLFNESQQLLYDPEGLGAASNILD